MIKKRSVAQLQFFVDHRFPESVPHGRGNWLTVIPDDIQDFGYDAVDCPDVNRGKKMLEKWWRKHHSTTATDNQINQTSPVDRADEKTRGI